MWRYLLYEIRVFKKYRNSRNRYIKICKNDSKKEIRRNIIIYDARKKLKFKDNYFDLALSINTLHNFKLNEMKKAYKKLKELVNQNLFV